MSARRVAVIALLSLFGCERENQVRLVIGARPEDDLLRGFACLQGFGPATMADRAFAGSEPRMSVIVDFVRLGGMPPSCRAAAVLEWCANHLCTPIGEDRVCLTVEVPGSIEQARAGVSEAIRSLSATIVTSDAPDQPVVARVVATVESCDGIMAQQAENHRFLIEDLIGCAYSCPVELDGFSSDLLLDLDTFGDLCDLYVNICASNPIDDGA